VKIGSRSLDDASLGTHELMKIICITIPFRHNISGRFLGSSSGVVEQNLRKCKFTNLVSGHVTRTMSL